MEGLSFVKGETKTRFARCAVAGRNSQNHTEHEEIGDLKWAWPALYRQKFESCSAGGEMVLSVLF